MIESFIFSELSAQAKIVAFLDLADQMKIDLAKQVYERLSLSEPNDIWTFIRQYCSSNVAKQTIFDNEFIQQIDQLVTNATEARVLRLAQHNQSISSFIDIYVNERTFHSFMNFGELLPEKDQPLWFNQIIKATHNVYIDFNEHDKQYLKYFPHLHIENQIKLLSQSNLFKYLSLDSEFFNQDMGTLEMELFSQSRRHFYSHYVKSAIVLRALVDVEHPNCDDFFDYFKLNKKEAKHLTQEVLGCYDYLSLPENRLKTFLHHNNLELSSILDFQLREDPTSFDLKDVFYDLDTLKKWIPFLGQESKKIKEFSNFEFVLCMLNDIKTFFKLDDTHEHLVEFLKATHFYKNTMTDEAILKKLYKMVSHEPDYGYMNYGKNEEDIQNFLIPLEKAILSEKLKTTEKEEKVSPKIKI